MDRAQDYFGYQPGDVQLSACAYCVHNQGKGTCSAFPNGIPDDILTMKNDHLQSVEGDQGIRFESEPGVQLPPRLMKE